MAKDRVIRRALISVSQKIGLVSFAQALAAHNVELISTGGTRKILVEAGLDVQDISDFTGFPEILDGRVKTLHPHVHAGILARRDLPEHQETLTKFGIDGIDLVVCNLYPFESVVNQPGTEQSEIIENIDIGGPTLVRAAAKNYEHVTVVTCPEQYALVTEELQRRQGGVSFEVRERLAAAAFQRIAAYDRVIADYFLQLSEHEATPPHLHLHFERRSILRYGENPHQKAAFYVEPGFQGAAISTAQFLRGKELSFNNILDLDSALGIVRSFKQPAAVVIKHNNPCGAAVAATIEDAYRLAHDGDPVSAFGGVLGFNREVDASTATLLTEPDKFTEAIIAPDFSPEALNILSTRPKWKDSVRLLRVGKLSDQDRSEFDYRRVEGGLLVQTRYLQKDELLTAKVVTKRQPTEQEWNDLRFAWEIVKHVKSNAIVFAREGTLVGVGAGQMSRVDSVMIASRKSGDRAHGAVMASDAFFPFRDNIDEAAKAGISAIVQPGGSIRDKDSVAACDEHGMAMVLTGMRHFRH
jgi:phosphoribosylaminoimidazolecarboxamide formyltransferase/IMP cyclohydrolase